MGKIIAVLLNNEDELYLVLCNECFEKWKKNEKLISFNDMALQSHNDPDIDGPDPYTAFNKDLTSPIEFFTKKELLLKIKEWKEDEHLECLEYLLHNCINCKKKII